MLGHKERGQTELVFAGSIAEFIPDDHILMRVDRVLDLSWLRQDVGECYSDGMGRPGIDPEVAVRLMLAGLLLGIVHDRHLMREAQVNLAIRWFAGFGLLEALPDHSSLTRIRQRWGAERFRTIFAKTVEACSKAGLVSGDMLHIDATLIRADVSWQSLAVQYVDAIHEANDGDASDDASDDASGDGGSGGSPPRDGTSGAAGKSASKPKRLKISRTDPDARMATNKYNQRLEPCYKQLTGVDSKYGINVDVTVISAGVHEGHTLMDHIQRCEARTGKQAATVTADRGYGSAANLAALEARGTRSVIPPQQVTRPSRVPLSRFRYDDKNDILRCPEGRHLKPASRVKDGRFYRSKRQDCQGCRLAHDCLPNTTRTRSVIIKDGHGALLRARRRHARRLPEDYSAYISHKYLVEGMHGEAKARHGLDRAVRRGLENVAIQSWLTAAAINLKRLAKAVLLRILQQIWALRPNYNALRAVLEGKLGHCMT